MRKAATRRWRRCWAGAKRRGYGGFRNGLNGSPEALTDSDGVVKWRQQWPTRLWGRERHEALKDAHGVAAAARELNLYESQLYNWRSKQQNQLSSSDREQAMPAEIARLKRQLAERDEELAILQKAPTYFAKRLK